MSIAWLAVDDPPSVKSDRRFIERNAIALLTSPMLAQDPASAEWLGRFSPHSSIRNSGLWNVQDFQVLFDPKFFEVLAYYIDVTLGMKSSTQRSIAPSRHAPSGRPTSLQQELFTDD
jgi:hypothetical protein